MRVCFSCKKPLDAGPRPGRGETCPSCSADLKVCLNCRFYDPSYYNECTETSAERVIEKTRGNFCEYFVFRDEARGPGAKDALGKLKGLFKE